MVTSPNEWKILLLDEKNQKILQKQQQMDKLDKKSSRAFGSGELKMTMIKMLVDNDKENNIKSACLWGQEKFHI